MDGNFVIGPGSPLEHPIAAHVVCGVRGAQALVCERYGRDDIVVAIVSGYLLGNAVEENSGLLEIADAAFRMPPLLSDGEHDLGLVLQPETNQSIVLAAGREPEAGSLDLAALSTDPKCSRDPLRLPATAGKDKGPAPSPERGLGEPHRRAVRTAEKLAPRVGFEPTTRGLTVRCSAN